MIRVTTVILSTLALAPALVMAQAKPVPVPTTPKSATAAPAGLRATTATPSIEKLDILGVRNMSEGEKAVACVAALRIVGGSASDETMAKELTTTADKFREHAVKSGITDEKGGQLMQSFGQKFGSVKNEQDAIGSLDFYAVNCMRTAHAMGMTTLDVTKPRPAATTPPAAAKPLTPKK